MKKIKIILLTMIGLMLMVTQSYAADTNIKDGKSVYTKWCTPCHEDGPMYPGTNALAAKYEGAIPSVLEKRTDMNDAFVKLFVRQGVSIMPFFRKTEITDTELDNLAAYLARNYKK